MNTYIPRNKEHFQALIGFLKDLLKICDGLKIAPVVYGSLAYAMHTQDESVDINDIDLLVPEVSFPKLIEKIADTGFLKFEETTYHSLKVFKDELKISFDAIEEYYKGLPDDFHKETIHDVPVQIVGRQALIEVYKRGRDTIPFKHDVYNKKLEVLIQPERS